MALTKTDKRFEHGLGRGVVFPIVKGKYGSGIEIKGLRAQSESPEASQTDIWADMEGEAFFTQQGAVTRTTEVTSLGYPEEFAVHALGKELKNGFLQNNPRNYNRFALVFAEWQQDEVKGELIQVNIYYNLQASPASVERAVDEGEITATEKPITCGVSSTPLAGTDFASFVVDPNDPEDPNLDKYKSIYETGTIVTPLDTPVVK